MSDAIKTEWKTVEKPRQKELVSEEARSLGIEFCCGVEERLVHENGKLRNIIQLALINSDRASIVKSWNYHFPDKPLT